MKKKKEIMQEDMYDEEIIIRKRRKKSSGRRCKSCGKDPFPNYFYCPACHHKVSHSNQYEEYDDVKT